MNQSNIKNLSVITDKFFYTCVYCQYNYTMFRSIILDRIIALIICSIVILIGLRSPFNFIYMGMKVAFNTTIIALIVELLKDPRASIINVFCGVLLITMLLTMTFYTMYCVSNVIAFRLEHVFCE
jgi:hypothetical protein